MQQDVLMSANETAAIVPSVPALFGHYMLSVLSQHLQHPDNILGQFKIIELIYLLNISHVETSSMFVKNMN